MGRRAYLRFILKLALVQAVIIVAGIFLASQGLRAAGYAAALLILVSGASGYAATIRRLHDRNRSGWWACVNGVAIPVGYWLEAAAKTYPLPAAGALLVLLAYNLWMLIELYFRRGTPGPNNFGDQPNP